MLSSAKTARRSDTWLVRSGALSVALEPISGPFAASGSFCSRLAGAVRPCGAAAELIGRRVSSSGSVALGSRAGRERRDGAVYRGAAGFATLQANVVAAMAKDGQRGARGMRQPPGGGDQLFQLRALIALEQFDPRAIFVPWRAPSLLAPPSRSGPPPYFLRSSLSTNPRSCSAERPCWVSIASRAHRPRWPSVPRQSISTSTLGPFRRRVARLPFRSSL